MKKCLITGSTGLIGKELLPLLIRDRWELYTLSRRHSEKEFYSFKNIKCDLLDEWALDKFPKKVDIVIHLAQSEHFRDFPNYAEHIFCVNTLSTIRLLQYARKAGAKAFILASSGGVYSHGDKRFKEDKPISAKGDLGFYAGTKLCSEVLAENYTSYMSIIILRFFFVYGPGQRSSMLIPRLLRSVRSGKPILLHGQNGIRINPIYVTDAAKAVFHTLDLKESQKINIGGIEILTIRQICEQISKILRKEPFFEIWWETQKRCCDFFGGRLFVSRTE
jgi:nucleoside-diphosphate-sugar epimerase